MLYVLKEITYTDGYTESVTSNKVPHDWQDVRGFRIRNVAGKVGKYYYDKRPSDGSELLMSEICYDPSVELSDMIAARITETDMLATRDIETILLAVNAKANYIRKRKQGQIENQLDGKAMQKIRRMAVLTEHQKKVLLRHYMGLQVVSAYKQEFTRNDQLAIPAFLYHIAQQRGESSGFYTEKSETLSLGRANPTDLSYMKLALKGPEEDFGFRLAKLSVSWPRSSKGKLAVAIGLFDHVGICLMEEYVQNKGRFINHYAQLVKMLFYPVKMEEKAKAAVAEK